MSTSGTIGTTSISVAQMLEHAFRRCGVLPSKITPEDEQSARESLYFFMVSLAARGINLWCVAKYLIGLQANQGTYALPTGTIEVLNWVHSQPQEAAGTTSVVGNGIQTDLGSATQITRYGIKFSTAPSTATIGTLAGSTDGLSWTSLQVQESKLYVANQWYWFDVDPQRTYQYFRFEPLAIGVLDGFFAATSTRDLPIKPWNRDDWANQPIKTRTGTPATNLYFEKLIAPQFTLWPVPSNATDHVSAWIHREIQDVGALTNNLEIPTRWMEHVLWQFAFRVAAEVPSASERLQFLENQAMKYQIESEYGETDNAPIYMAPNISVYTR